MSRVDYYHQEDAPEATSLVPAASVIAMNGAGEILLHKRADSGLWSIPGGKQEPGESIRQTAVREAKEETGYDVELTRLVGIFSDPGHVVAYSDGEVRQEFSVCFAAVVVGGERTLSVESDDVRFCAAEELQDLAIHESIRFRLSNFLDHRSEPWTT